MKKEFIPYEQALALKELGFNEPCLAWYPVTDILLLMGMKLGSINPDFVTQDSPWIQSKKIETCIAPLYSQAFRWFRDKRGLIGNVESEYFDNDSKQEFYPVIKLWASGEELDKLQLEHDELDGGLDCVSKTYEEAELACVVKLIEIVKSK
jgi:hypothetical protein